MMPLVARNEGGTPDIDMWHVHSDIFGSLLRAGETIALLDSPVISVIRHTMPADKKTAFEEKSRDLGVWSFLEEVGRPYAIRGAWKVEGGEPGTAEWVVVAGCPNAEQYMRSVKDAFLNRLREMIALLVRFEVQHYRRLS